MSRTEMKFKVSENMVMWAFRYALGRRTGAVDSVVIHLQRHWKKLEPFTQEQIKREIKEVCRHGSIGWKGHDEMWSKVLDL